MIIQQVDKTKEPMKTWARADELAKAGKVEEAVALLDRKIDPDSDPGEPNTLMIRVIMATGWPRTGQPR